MKGWRSKGTQGVAFGGRRNCEKYRRATYISWEEFVLNSRRDGVEEGCSGHSLKVAHIRLWVGSTGDATFC